MHKLLRSLLLMVFVFVLNQTAVADEADVSAYNTAFQEMQKSMLAKRLSAALYYAQEAYDLSRKAFGDNDKRTAEAAMFYGMLSHGQAAIDILAKSAAIYEGLYGANSKEMVTPLILIGKACIRSGEPREGNAYFARAIATARQATGENSLQTGQTYLRVAVTQIKTGHLQDAYSGLVAATGIFRSADNAEARLLLGRTQYWTAQYDLANKRPGDAIEALQEALKNFDEVGATHQHKNTPVDQQYLLITHEALVAAYTQHGMTKDATRHCLAISRLTPEAQKGPYLPVYRTAPVYPSIAKHDGSEGMVVFAFTVTKDGFVKSPKVVSLIGSKHLVKPARKALEAFRYAPKLVDGQPVDTQNVQYSFTFRLED